MALGWHLTEVGRRLRGIWRLMKNLEEKKRDGTGVLPDSGGVNEN
jgi:hypothetical protein